VLGSVSHYGRGGILQDPAPSSSNSKTSFKIRNIGHVPARHVLATLVSLVVLVAMAGLILLAGLILPLPGSLGTDGATVSVRP
jgi:hypothetical protein